MLYITHARLHTPDGVVENGALLAQGGHIAALGPVEEVRPPAGCPTLNAGGHNLLPGFIDLQVNGGFGRDLTRDPTTIWQVAAELTRFGVTAFLPTIITSLPETIRAAQQVLAEGPPADFHGAWPLGLHLEGPFLNPARKGAHDADLMRVTDPALAAEWSPETHVRLVTLAPELPGALPLVRELVARSIVVGAGHSMASYDEARAGFDAGIRYGTHLFNAMPPLHHRRPGLAGALLSDERVTVGLIADDVHVHPGLLPLLRRAVGRRMTLVSDAMAALGMDDDTYRLGDSTVTVAGGRARLSDGTLAGSVTPLDEMLRRWTAGSGAALTESVAAVSRTPAALLGLPDRGALAPGQVADAVLLDAERRVAATVVRGEPTFWQPQVG